MEVIVQFHRRTIPAMQPTLRRWARGRLMPTVSWRQRPQRIGRSTRVEYQDAVTVLNSHIFGTEKVPLLERKADTPSRFVGLFRPPKPQAKILQYLLQSNEIRFGDAMEEVIRLLIAEMGYTNLPRELISATGDDLSVDQYFKGPDKYYFIEQKVRDDHDSTKKRGQVENFEQKLDILSSQHPGSLVGAMFFIDPDLSKNKTFYTERLSQLQTNYNAELHLFYGKQMFTYLGDQSVWAKLIKWLSEWKGSLPDLPDLNLDASMPAEF